MIERGGIVGWGIRGMMIALGALGLAAGCDDSSGGGGNVDGGGAVTFDAGDQDSPSASLDAAAPPDAPPGACDVDGPFIVYGDSIAQVSKDWKTIVRVGRVRAPGGTTNLSFLDVVAPIGHVGGRTYVRARKDCPLCIVDPAGFHDGFVEATPVPATDTSGGILGPSDEPNLLVAAYGEINQHNLAGPSSDLGFVYGDLFSGLSNGTQYPCVKLNYVAGHLFVESGGNHGYDLYGACEVTLPTTSIDAIIHVRGAFTPQAGHAAPDLYEVLGSNENSVTRYPIRRFDAFSRSHLFAPYAESSGTAGALHVVNGAFVLDTTDYAEVCDPVTGVRTKVPPIH